MRLIQIGTIAAVTGGLVFAFQNCARQGQITAGESNPTQMLKVMDDLEGEIRTLSQRDLACSTDDDCAKVAVGALHCGLPSFEVVNSKLSSDHPRVLTLADQYKEIESEYLRSPDIVVSCGGVVHPTPVCEKNICVIPVGR